MNTCNCDNCKKEKVDTLFVAWRYVDIDSISDSISYYYEEEYYPVLELTCKACGKQYIEYPIAPDCKDEIGDFSQPEYRRVKKSDYIVTSSAQFCFTEEQRSETIVPIIKAARTILDDYRDELIARKTNDILKRNGKSLQLVKNNNYRTSNKEQ